MRKRTLWILSVAVLVLAVVPIAEAVIPCGSCPYQPPNRVCGTTCSGEFVTMRCYQWLLVGCEPIEFAPTSSLELFLLSLAEEAESPAEPIQIDAE